MAPTKDWEVKNLNAVLLNIISFLIVARKLPKDWKIAEKNNLKLAKVDSSWLRVFYSMALKNKKVGDKKAWSYITMKWQIAPEK